MGEIKDTVFIIDDDISVRRCLSFFLMTYDFSIETYSSSEEFLNREPYEGIGCILLDINLGGKSGLELQEELWRLDSQIPIIFITGHGTIHLSVETLKKGAVNFLEKPFKNEELLDAVSEAILLSQNIKEGNDEIRRAKALINKLTSREYEILKYLMTGLLNKQIAAELKIAEQTVKIHRGNICKKFRVKSVVGIMSIADKAGLVPYGKIT
jgi:FixJ family two-component response regulator